jgi:hypothetical protein
MSLFHIIIQDRAVVLVIKRKKATFLFKVEITKFFENKRG